jgi:hypothetical protein
LNKNFEKFSEKFFTKFEIKTQDVNFKPRKKKIEIPDKIRKIFEIKNKNKIKNF